MKRRDFLRLSLGGVGGFIVNNALSNAFGKERPITLFREVQDLNVLKKGLRIAEGYNNGTIRGWDGARLAEEKFYLIKPLLHTFEPQMIKNAVGKKCFLYHATRKVLGQDTPNYPQEIGDCVSFSAKNGAEYLSACDIVLREDWERFRLHFPPWFYGASRVLVGGWDNRYSDGSLVSYASKAVLQYGCLFSDEAEVPRYSGQLAKEWGAKRNILNKWVPTAKNYLIQSTALVTTWEEFVAAICNGYPVVTGSGVGYAMKPSADGFHRQSGGWNHAMTFIGVDDRASDPYALLLNSWGDGHGHLMDFENPQEQIPIGVLRVRKSDVMKHLRERESFAWSQFNGFPETKIDERLFRLLGKR